MEEIYKVLRAGFAESTFRMLVDTGLLAAIAPEVPGRITATFWQSLAAIDNYRRVVQAESRNARQRHSARLASHPARASRAASWPRERTGRALRHPSARSPRRRVPAADSDAAAPSARPARVAAAQARRHASQRVSGSAHVARAPRRRARARRVVAGPAVRVRRTTFRKENSRPASRRADADGAGAADSRHRALMPGIKASPSGLMAEGRWQTDSAISHLPSALTSLQTRPTRSSGRWFCTAGRASARSAA